MSLLGKIDEFNCKDDDICEYMERVEHYFYANNIEDEKKQTAIFLTVIGSEMYSLLRCLLAPDVPSTKSVQILCGRLKDHLKRQPILIAKRYKFYTRDQKQDESVSEYIAELRKLSLYCEFKAFLDDALRDKFVCGLKKSNIRRRLLTEKALTLQTAVEIAKNLDQAEFENEFITTEGKSGKYYTYDIRPS